MDESVFKGIFDEYIEKFGNIELQELPKEMNVDRMIEEEMKRKYAKICPYCHHEALGDFVTSYERDVHRYGKWWQFWKPKHSSCQLTMRCTKCGLVWLSPWFPQDLMERAIKDYKKKNGQNPLTKTWTIEIH